MKGIVFLGNRQCEVRELPIPKPAPDQVLIRVMATGICGSDLSVYRSAYQGKWANGHEASGIVESTGSQVRRLKVGDRVAAHHHYGCGTCSACARGEVVACKGHTVLGMGAPGSFAEFTAAPERCCVPLPEPISFIDGAFMACVGGTAYAAIRRLDTTIHDTLAVFGLGPVGLSCVLAGKAFGLRVVGIDILPHRLDLATACGADLAVDGSQPDAVDQVVAFSALPGFPAEGVDHAIETSGSAAARRMLIPSMRRGGRIAIVGVGSNDEVINPSHIHGKAVTIFG